MKRINITEDQYRKLSETIDEISYRTVNRASNKSDNLFYKLGSTFSDFEDALNDVYVGDNNPYLEKIKGLSDEIRDILDKKMQQSNRFHKEMNNFDRNKFYDSDDAEEHDVYDMDLNYLQNKYPKE